jgi:SHAQKYF class myb-like DNA-binding protein
MISESLLFGLLGDEDQSENLLDIPFGDINGSDSGHTDTDSTDSDHTVSGRWTAKEHDIFLEGLKQHGKGWKKIAEMIVTRNVVQVRTHAQKYFQKLERSKLASESSIAAATHTAARGAPGSIDETISGDMITAKRKRKYSKNAQDAFSQAKRGKKASSPGMTLQSSFDTHNELKIDPTGSRQDSLISTPSPTSVAEDAILNVPKMNLSEEHVLDDWIVAGNTSVNFSGDLLGEMFSKQKPVDFSTARTGFANAASWVHSSEYVGDMHSFDDDTFMKGILEIFNL